MDIDAPNSNLHNDKIVQALFTQGYIRNTDYKLSSAQNLLGRRFKKALYNEECDGIPKSTYPWYMT